MTGWYWDDDEWRTSSGYRPTDLDTLEWSMVAFADHHDTDENVFLGNTLPVGKTAEQDLAMVLKALVCINLAGGNDSFNMFIPSARLRTLTMPTHGSFLR